MSDCCLNSRICPRSACMKRDTGFALSSTMICGLQWVTGGFRIVRNHLPWLTGAFVAGGALEVDFCTKVVENILSCFFT